MSHAERLRAEAAAFAASQRAELPEDEPVSQPPAAAAPAAPAVPGRSRWLGIRPQTRGVAMNPVDHPMGGGEGKSSGGHPKSPTGVYAKGFKTRKKNKASNQDIVRRRKTKKK